MPRSICARAVFRHVQRRTLERAAAEAPDVAWFAALLDRLPRIHERAEVFAMDEARAFPTHRRESGRDPSADRLLVNPEEVSKFGDLVWAMDFDAAAIKPPRHGLLRLLDNTADVLDLPGGRARPQLHRLWKPPRLHARPPRRPTDWDRSVGREDRRESDESVVSEGRPCFVPWHPSIDESVSDESVPFSPMRRRKDASGNVSLEIVTTTARVIPLLGDAQKLSLHACYFSAQCCSSILGGTRRGLCSGSPCPRRKP